PTSQAQNTQPVKGKIQTSPSGTITNIPKHMVTDQFGMIGLLTFIRAAETEPNLVTLALGSDLTTLGLNLNSPESLYQTFGSPFSDSPCRPHEIDFNVPPEYRINSYIREKLAPFKLGRYGEDVLFYLYYTNEGDVLQLAAAAELYSRDWRYHKDERVWLTRVPGVEPLQKTEVYERGTYYIFDYLNWRKIAKEFHLEYKKLEEKPALQTLAAQ
ncbi:CCR4-NOT transcription complex subunit 2-like, partial [Paramuricea clavata]